MKLAPSLEGILLEGVRRVPDAQADRYFDYIADACRTLGETITDKQLKRAVAIAVSKCNRESVSCTA